MQLLVSVLVIAGERDTGIVQPAFLATRDQVILQALVQVVLLATIVTARMSRRSALVAVGELERAVRVAAHRDGDGLSVLSFDGGQLIVPLLRRELGQRLRVRIRAEDVMLAAEEPRTISANNVLLSTVTNVRESGATHADIQLLCGKARFVARITRACSRCHSRFLMSSRRSM